MHVTLAALKANQDPKENFPWFHFTFLTSLNLAFFWFEAGGPKGTFKVFLGIFHFNKLAVFLAGITERGEVVVRK